MQYIVDIRLTWYKFKIRSVAFKLSKKGLREALIFYNPVFITEEYLSLERL
jgi:hypothetical protein